MSQNTGLWLNYYKSFSLAYNLKSQLIQIQNLTLGHIIKIYTKKKKLYGYCESPTPSSLTLSHIQPIRKVWWANKDIVIYY